MIKVEASKLELQKLFSDLDKISNVDLDNALNKVGILVEGTAQENLRRAGKIKSGNLVRSIKYRRPDKNTVEVFTVVPYATYVEFGTGTYAEAGNGRPGWWVWVDESCNAPKSKFRKIYTYDEALTVYWSLVKIYGEDNVHITQGQRPTRFLRNALDDNEDNIIKILSESI